MHIIPVFVSGRCRSAIKARGTGGALFSCAALLCVVVLFNLRRAAVQCLSGGGGGEEYALLLFNVVTFTR